MKKLLLFAVLTVVVVFFGLGLSSCGSSPSGPQGPTATPTPTTSGPSSPGSPQATATPTETLCPTCPTLTPTPSPSPSPSPTPCTTQTSISFGVTGDTARQVVIQYGSPSTGFAAVTQAPPFASSAQGYCSGVAVYVTAYYNDPASGSTTMTISNGGAVTTSIGNTAVVNGSGVTTGNGYGSASYVVP